MLQDKPKTYFHGLDGLRFLAFMVVMGAHLAHPLSAEYETGWLHYVLSWFQFGYLAVDLFFVLSAFLISWWGFREMEQHGRFRFRRYFARRAIRIWPLYFLMVLISVLVIQLQRAGGMPESPMPSIWHYLTFTLNFAALEGDQFLMVILWSISVEEQYYILNGLLMRFAPRYFAAVNVLIWGGSIVFRIMHLDAPLTLHYHTLSVMACFAAGNLLAWLICRSRYKSTLENFYRQQGANIPLWLLVGGLAAYPILASYPWVFALEKAWIPVLFAAAIGYQYFRTSGIFSLEKRRWINYLGKISYGLYCFHGLVIAVFVNTLHVAGMTYPPQQPWLALVVYPMLMLCCTVLLAHLSYRWFELPVLRLRDHFR